MAPRTVRCKNCKLALLICTERAPHGDCHGFIHVMNLAHRCPNMGAIAELEDLR